MTSWSSSRAANRAKSRPGRVTASTSPPTCTEQCFRIVVTRLSCNTRPGTWPCRIASSVSRTHPASPSPTTSRPPPPSSSSSSCQRQKSSSLHRNHLLQRLARRRFSRHSLKKTKPHADAANSNQADLGN